MKKISKLALVALLLTTSCVGDDVAPRTNAVTAAPPVAEHVVRASRFVYDTTAERVVATRFVVDPAAPALRGSAFAIVASN